MFLIIKFLEFIKENIIFEEENIPKKDSIETLSIKETNSEFSNKKIEKVMIGNDEEFYENNEIINDIISNIYNKNNNLEENETQNIINEIYQKNLEKIPSKTTIISQENLLKHEDSNFDINNVELINEEEIESFIIEESETQNIINEIYQKNLEKIPSNQTIKSHNFEEEKVLIDKDPIFEISPVKSKNEENDSINFEENETQNIINEIYQKNLEKIPSKKAINQEK
jgi:hypothetical protein